MFINCPFDPDYDAFFEVLIFTVLACGFRPRSAKELRDGGELRFDKICRLISACRYGIHDISRTELDPQLLLPRFNMPLELGLFLGAKRFGDKEQKKKKCLILDIDKFRYMKFVSDLNGMDIEARSGNPADLIVPVRDWLRNISNRKIEGGLLIAAAYQRFQQDLPATLAALGLQSPAPDTDIASLRANGLWQTAAAVRWHADGRL